MPGFRRILTSLVVAWLIAALACDRRSEESAEPVAAEGDDPTAHVPSGEPLVVVGRVVELTLPHPCTEDQTFAVPVTYEKVRVESGDFGEERFSVRMVCPERAREEGDAGPLSVGDLHRLHLDPTPYRTRRTLQWIPVRTDAASR